MVAVGMLLVLVGFALMAPRGGIPGSAAARNVKIGWMRVMNTRGYDGTPTRRYRAIQVLMGLVVMAGGIVIIAVST